MSSFEDSDVHDSGTSYPDTSSILPDSRGTF